MTDNELRIQATDKAKEQLSQILIDDPVTPYERMRAQLIELNYQLLKQSAESAAALSSMQESYQEQIGSLKKQIARRESVHKL